MCKIYALIKGEKRAPIASLKITHMIRAKTASSSPIKTIHVQNIIKD